MQIKNYDIAVSVGGVALVTNAETDVQATGLIFNRPDPGNAPFRNAKAHVHGAVVINVGGTTTSALVMKLYRGATKSGVLIGTLTFKLTPDDVTPSDQSIELILDAIDNPTAAYTQYAISLAQTGADGNGAVTFSSIETKILSD